MWVWSHVMVSTIVFGPNPEAVLGAILPDLFNIPNWFLKFETRKVSFKLMLKSEKRFDKKLNSGLVWDTDQIFHSFSCTAVALLLTAHFYNQNPVLFRFFGSWALHVLIDYLTHKDQFFPFFPFFEGFGFRLGLINYNPRNAVALVTDLALFALTLVRLGHLPL